MKPPNHLNGRYGNSLRWTRLLLRLCISVMPSTLRPSVCTFSVAGRPNFTDKVRELTRGLVLM
jgi:hypothetical protein